jgi:hypothetical protein
VGGQEDHGELGPPQVGAEDLEEGQAVHLGHADVEDDDVGAAVDEGPEGGAAVGDAGGAIPLPLEEALHELTAVRFVVNDQHVRHTGES